MIDPFISDLLLIRLANFELDTAEAELNFRKLSGGRRIKDARRCSHVIRA